MVIACAFVLSFDDAFDFDSRLFEYPVHLDTKRVGISKEFEGKVSRLLVGEQR